MGITRGKVRPMNSVAVVIPTHGTSPFLLETLQSVMQQTYRDFAAVIVAGGCTDETVKSIEAAIADDGRFRIVRQPNLGAGAARNRGAAESQSEFLAFLDHDDLWDPRFLEAVLAALQSDPSAPAAHCVSQGITAAGDPQGDFANWSRVRQRAERGRLVPSPPGPTTFEALVTAPCIASPGAAIVRRDAFSRIGEYDTNLPPVEDWDLFLRLTRLGALLFLDEVLFFYRKHDDNTYVHNRATQRTVARLRRAAIAHPDNTPEMKRYAREATRTFYVDQGKGSLREPGMRSRVRGLPRVAYGHAYSHTFGGITAYSRGERNSFGKLL